MYEQSFVLEKQTSILSDEDESREFDSKILASIKKDINKKICRIAFI